MSRDNWVRLVEAVVRRDQIWQMFHDHSRSPSISTIPSEDDDRDPTNHFSGQLTIDSLKAFSVSPSVSVRNPPVVSQADSKKKRNANSTGPFPLKLFSSWYRRRKSEFDLGHNVRRFSISEIQAATDNFSQDNRLGRPGFSEVHKGRLSDGSEVVIKRFKLGTRQDADLHFQIEVEVMGKVVHSNIIPLLGYCIAPKERMLIYPLMVNGSVASCLRERPLSQAPLNWSIRKRIALGSAKGLAYLHDKCDPKIIHRDVKAANILLDEDFNAVFVDFELAVLMGHNDSHLITTDHLITGQRAFDLARLAIDHNVILLDWVKRNLLEKTWRTLLDLDCEADHGDLMEEEVEQVIQLALICTLENPMGRPKMSEIVKMLEDGSGLVEKWEQWQEEETRNYIIKDDTSNIPPDELSGPR